MPIERGTIEDLVTGGAISGDAVALGTGGMFRGAEGAINTPIIELIAANIAAAINQITIENGFNQTLIAIRPKRNDFASITPADGLVLIMQTDEDEAGEQAIGTKGWNQTFVLMAFVIESDAAVGSIDTRINQVRADMQKKLKEDPYRAGYALNTRFERSRLFDDARGFSGVEVPAVVDYRTRWEDPYQIG